MDIMSISTLRIALDESSATICGARPRSNFWADNCEPSSNVDIAAHGPIGERNRNAIALADARDVTSLFAVGGRDNSDGHLMSASP